MEEPAVQQEKMEGWRDGGRDGGKTGWKDECSLSSLLKHSCLFCWSSNRDGERETETDERILAKAAEIRELETAVSVEQVELQEQQSDRGGLEETLEKLERNKETLLQEIRATRQLCYQESQQILSLQAEEVQRESQVEEYERELARARWRLRRLKEEVKTARRRAEEAGRRSTPLQESIRQSYEEILQEESTLCCLSGGAATPETPVEDSTSPADTTEDEPLPLRPWGRSQSLPAYADLIMESGGSPFCNNLAGTREEDDSGTSSPKMDRSDLDDDPEEEETTNEEEEEEREKKRSSGDANTLDFYQPDPFNHCQADHDLFNEDLFPKTDSSDGFGSDPFKGSDPFAADVLFAGEEPGVAAGDDGVEEADLSLSCAENKASTGTQCFESEFPDEDSDIEISYSREDLDALATGGPAHTTGGPAHSFKPINSSEEELQAVPVHGWRSQNSAESDPNGYELDLGAFSPPSDIEEQVLGSFAGDATPEDANPEDANPEDANPEDANPEDANPEDASPEDASPEDANPEDANPEDATPEDANPEDANPEDANPEDAAGRQRALRSDWLQDPAASGPLTLASCLGSDWASDEEELPAAATPQNSVDRPNPPAEPGSPQSGVESSYGRSGQSSFDPYGFKLSPEHSSHTLLDPDEAELSPEPADNELTFDPEPSPPPADPLSFHHYDFDTAAAAVRDCDPYGFKLSPEEENQEGHDLGPSDGNEPIGTPEDSNQEVLNAESYENREVLERCGPDDQAPLDLCNHGNQEVFDNREVVTHGNQELLDLWSHGNQEVVMDSQDLFGPCNYGNQEVLEPVAHGNQDLLDISVPENQEVPDVDNQGNRELPDVENQEVLVDRGDNRQVEGRHGNQNEELLDFSCHDNQRHLLSRKESLSEANNNRLGSANSSDSDAASDDLPGLSNTNMADLALNATNMAAAQDQRASTAPNRRGLLDGDLGAVFGSVFGSGGYIGCPDVADDLEPMDRRTDAASAAPERPERPVRPPRPSLRGRDKGQPPSQGGIDLK